MPTKSCRLAWRNFSNRSVSTLLNKFVLKRKHKEGTKGTNLQSGLLKNKISCFCDVVKIPQPASLWNYSRDILAFLLCEEPSLCCCSCSGMDPFLCCYSSTCRQRPQKGACSFPRREDESAGPRAAVCKGQQEIVPCFGPVSEHHWRWDHGQHPHNKIIIESSCWVCCLFFFF